MKTYPFLAVFICLCVNTAAQEYSFKYGKITPDELRMTLYEPEPDAPAVFIYDDTDIHYSFGNSIQLLCYRTVKIKVFKDEGVKWGDVAIDFGNYQLSKEVVSRIDAAAYNLVDGKTVKTQLKRQNIFEEVLDEHTKRLKFSISEVRAGTVIEYRYLLTSDFIGQIPDVDVQHAIPVVRSTAQISIPEYFTHHIHTRGYLTLPVKKELENGGAAGFSGFSYTNTKYICNIDRVPSLRKEPYVWHLDDFRAGLEFEINGLEIPGSLYKSFTRSWADVYVSLDRSEFGRYADIRNPFKDEVAAIVARNADDERRQLHEILKFVQSRIAWDGTYRLTPESSPHAAVDKGRGDSGSINFILAAALRDAGFKPEIILLNPRSAGRLPLTHATDRIRTFVLRTKLKSGETVYLDATDLHSDVNVLPTQLLVDHARLYSPEHPFENWINLSSPAQSIVLSQITARLTEEGELECTETDTETNQAAYDLSRRYSRSENHDTFVQEYEQRAGITISELTVDGLNTAKARMKLNFRKPVDSGGDFLYICPTIVPFIEKNPFTSQKRQLPVEFSYPYRYRIIVSLMLPEGYTVEELPKSQRLSACNEGIACTMQLQQQGALMQCLFEFDLSRIIFPATEYTDLSAFYGFVMDMCNSRIVLKKS